MSDTIDDGMAVAGNTDWITPLVGMVQDVVRGPHYVFYITRAGCPLSGREIDRLLSKNKVTHWGMAILPDDSIEVRVKKDQAQQAQQLMEQNGVPIENPLPRSQNHKNRRSVGHNPPSRIGSVFSVFDIFDT